MKTILVKIISNIQEMYIYKKLHILYQYILNSKLYFKIYKHIAGHYYIYKTLLVLNVIIVLGLTIGHWYEMYVFMYDRVLDTNERALNIELQYDFIKTIEKVISNYQNIIGPEIIERLACSFLTFYSLEIASNFSNIENNYLSIDHLGNLMLITEPSDICNFFYNFHGPAEIVRITAGDNWSEDLQNEYMKKILIELKLKNIKIYGKDDSSLRVLIESYNGELRNAIRDRLYAEYNKKPMFPALAERFPRLAEAPTVMTSKYTWIFIGACVILGVSIALCGMGFPPLPLPPNT